MKRFINITSVLFISLLLTSCFNKRHRNYEFFPDMYVPVGYEYYGDYKVFPGGQEAMKPVENTIPRGWMPYEYPNTNEGYKEAKADLKNPLAYTEDNFNKGKELYTIYCAICHGDKGNGKGTLVERSKILGVPSYNDSGRNITEGSVYHVMYYGLNSMGSYAVQTDEHERWQIDLYVMHLKRKLNGEPDKAFVVDQPEQKQEAPAVSESDVHSMHQSEKAHEAH